MVSKLFFFVSFISHSLFALCSIHASNYVSIDVGNGESSLQANGLLNVSVFYESLCPDSVDFFKNQFSNNWFPFYDYLNITLIPYGHASQKRDETGKWTFVCQHGEKECQGNRIQACAIAGMYKQHRQKLFNFISCYMSHTDKDQYGPKCAHSNNIVFRRLKKCAASLAGAELLAAFGNVTNEFKPTITWIPTIVINDKYNQTENDLASSNLKSLLCQKLNNEPKSCT